MIYLPIWFKELTVDSNFISKISMKKQEERYHLKIEAYDIKVLQYFDIIWKKISKKFSLSLKGPVFLPLKKKRTVLLKSPHVNKKAREIFIFKKYRYLYILSSTNTDKNKIFSFLTLIQKNPIAGSSLKIVKCVKKDSNFQPINS
jgi:small subunit ribosomal protein S10